MTTETIHANRIADLLGRSEIDHPQPRPAARFLLEIVPPLSPVPEAKLSYYVEAGAHGSKERDWLFQVLADYARIGTGRGRLFALATTYDADKQPMQQWKCEYDDEGKTWGRWR